MAAFWLQKYQLIHWLKEYVSRSKIVKTTCHVIRARAWLCKFEDVYLCITFLSQQWDKRSMGHSLFNFQSNLKIDVNFWFLWFFIIKNIKVANRFLKFFFFTVFILFFCRILNQYNNEVKNEAHRQSCYSDNVAVRDMAFFLFSTEVELIENWKLKISIHFQYLVFRKNFPNRWQNYPRGPLARYIFLCPQSPPHSLAS